MEKRITTIILCALLAVSVTACANGNDTENSTTEMSNAVSSSVSEKEQESIGGKQQTDCKREHRECKAYGDAGCKNGKQQNREFKG